MNNLYGIQPLTAPEIKGSFTLSNGMWCVWGTSTKEGLCFDVFDSKENKLLVGMEHGCGVFNTSPDQIGDMLHQLAESMKEDFEDSMVYYYGSKKSQFTEEDITLPVPEKFA